jgi:hypothetical protein
MHAPALSLFDRHRPALEQARAACRSRGHFSLFGETPDRHPGGSAAAEAAALAFRQQLGRARPQ